MWLFMPAFLRNVTIFNVNPFKEEINDYYTYNYGA